MILATLKAVVEDGRPKFGTRIMYWMFGKMGFVLPARTRVEALADVTTASETNEGRRGVPRRLLLPRRFRAERAQWPLPLPLPFPLPLGLAT